MGFSSRFSLGAIVVSPAVVLSAAGLIAACASEPMPPPISAAPNVPGSSGIQPMAMAPIAASLITGTSTTIHARPLIPGDLLEVRVYQQPDLDLTIRIPESGSVNYPLIGAVKAAGFTSTELEETLRAGLEESFLKEAHVNVTVKEFAPRKLYVLGGVQKPGAYELAPTDRVSLLQLISAAGGFTDRAHKERIQIVRRGDGTERETINLSLIEIERALASGQAAADIELWPDDLVVIGAGARVVYVLGAVKLPGSFDLPTDTRVTVAMAISKAGSYTKFAATSRIQILRQIQGGGSQKIPINLDDIVAGQLENDMDVAPGDVVWVPERGIF